MRPGRLLLYISCLGMVAIACSSCRGPTRGEQPGLLQPTESESIQDSGKRLSGEFTLKTVEDDYGEKNLQGQSLAAFRFEESGAFKIDRESGNDSMTIKEGTYVISARNELILYVEKVNGSLLSEARINRYLITDMGSDLIRLQSTRSTKYVLEKR
jgi:hypothetical protein